MMIGRPGKCFWRLFAICAVLVCIFNIFVLIGGGNSKEREHLLSNFAGRDQDSQQTSANVVLNSKVETTKVKTVNILQQHVVATTPLPSTQSTDRSEVIYKKPLWLPVLNLEKMFFAPDQILLLGRRRVEKGYIVIGVPTVGRSKAYYLTDTMRWLVSHLSVHQRIRTVIVVFVADLDSAYRTKVVNDMRTNFPTEVEEGLIQVIRALPEYYPDLNNLPLLYGDKANRVKWRSKQSLDYSFMYYYCADLAEFYIQIEDDVMAVPSYFDKIETYIEQRRNKSWSIIEFGARGFIGMTYRTKYLKSLARFSRFYFWTMPIDWIFRVYNDIYLFGNNKHNVLRPPVFKHIGEYSSLDGQRRPLEDLVKQKQKDTVAHIYQSEIGNPSANVTTTIRHWEDHDMFKAYGREGYFWGKSVAAGQYIEIALEHLTDISRIVILSGSPRHLSDCFLDTELSVSRVQYGGQCTGYRTVAQFVDSPTIDYRFNTTSPVGCIRLTLTKVKKHPNGNSFWLFIREIALL